MDTGTELPVGLVGLLPVCQGCKKTRWAGWTFDRMPLTGYQRYRWKCPCNQDMTWCPPTEAPPDRPLAQQHG